MTTTPSAAELMACPFCAGPVEVTLERIMPDDENLLEEPHCIYLITCCSVTLAEDSEAAAIAAWNTRPTPQPADGVTDDLEVAEAALQRLHDKFMERAHIDPGTGYPEYGGQEDYYIDLCSALDAVKALQDVPADPREAEFGP